MRFRAAVDVDADQYGPAPVHRRAAVPVAADAPPRHRAHRADVADRAGGVHARAVLVPRAGRTGHVQGQRVHAGVPQERHVPDVDRVHRVRGVAVVHPAAVAVRLPLSTDISQAEQDPAADRALSIAPVARRPHHVAEQPVTARQRNHATGTCYSISQSYLTIHYIYSVIIITAKYDKNVKKKKNKKHLVNDQIIKYNVNIYYNMYYIFIHKWYYYKALDSLKY